MKSYRPRFKNQRTPSETSPQEEAPKPIPAAKTLDKVAWPQILLEAKGDKASALRRFWTVHNLPDKAPQLIKGREDAINPADSTLGLFYHPTKRVLMSRRQGADQGYIPTQHREIYTKLLEQIHKPHLTRVQKSMVALHLRSGDGRHFLLVQCKPESPVTWKELNKFAEWIQREMGEQIGGVYIVTGHESPFRFGDTRGLQLRKSFGPDTLHAQIGEERLFFQPMDEVLPDRSLMPVRQDIAMQMLKPQATQTMVLVELGCGPETLSLSKQSQQVIVMDGGVGTREAYARNRERHGWQNVRFHKFDGGKSWDKLPACDALACGAPMVLTNDQVASLIATNANRIVRRYRGPAELEREWGKWRKAGWVMYRLKGLDTIPSHPDRMELWALFHKDDRGILQGRRPASRDEKAPDARDGRPRGGRNAGPRNEKPTERGSSFVPRFVQR